MGVQGTFVLHKSISNEWSMYDSLRANTGYLPASTFKIFNSLVALQEKAVATVDDTLKWDGIPRWADSWNQDHSMRSAIKVSAVWYYQEMARRIGRERMEYWIDTVHYGNQQTGAVLDSFWLNGDIRITAMQQVDFLQQLQNETLGFSRDVQKQVKEIMILDSTANYVLMGKTGWALSTPVDYGWFVGILQRKEDTWIFALQMDILANEDAPKRRQLAEILLKREGLLQ
jgi:beta-lactamase class D